ncbi:MAG: YgdI/YgdR family lipoprotein [Lachnospiraceae bacterium]|nr:YgdI/YgdR family lipoprotein [Lachnospiraceae bacterium]
MKKLAAVLLVIVMVFSLAACGKNEEPSSNTVNVVTKTAETTSAPEVTKEAEVTKAPEITKEAEVTKAPETTKEPEVTNSVETTPEPTDEPYIDEFERQGSVFDGTWKADGCTVLIFGEGAADIICACFEDTDRETYGSWHEIWTSYNEETRAFEGIFEIYFHFDGDELVSEEIGGTYTFYVKGENMRWAEKDLGFVWVSDELENPVMVDDANHGIIADESNPGHRFCGTYESDEAVMRVEAEGDGMFIRIFFNENEYGFYEYWVDFSEEEMTLRCDEINHRGYYAMTEEGPYEWADELDPTVFVIDDSGEVPLIGWPERAMDFVQTYADYGY